MTASSHNAHVVDHVVDRAIAESNTTARDLAFDKLWSLVALARWATLHTERSKLDKFRSYLMYASEHPARSKRTPMDIPTQVARWVPIIKGLSTAHEKADVDRCEFELDDHLTPLLTAPVAQLREFYAALCDALEADRDIPFFVHRTFRTWGEVILKRAPDGEIRELKKGLAAEIADMVEDDIRPDISKAIAGALQWRSPEALERTRSALRKGAKPHVVGRESCLFLEVDGLLVML